MDQKKLTELLHLQETEISKTTPFCPGGYEIAAFLEGKLNQADIERSERHLANCSYCRARATVLTRLYKNGDDVQIPDSLMAAANQFGNQPRRLRLSRAPAWAMAAVVILALFTIVDKEPLPIPTTGIQPLQGNTAGTEIRELRNINRTYASPRVLTPIEGASVHPDELTVHWTEVPGSLYYDVRLVDAEGFMIWRERVTKTQSDLPEQLRLISGNLYFVRVDAYLAEAKSISSPHVKFTIKGDD